MPMYSCSDEPTNFLNLHTMTLEDMIRNYPGTIVLISHDRMFGENVADRVFKISDRQLTRGELRYG